MRAITGTGMPRVKELDLRGGQGFTLVELLVTLAIAAILMMLAVPSMEDAALNSKLRSQANAFLASLHLARSEAIKRNGRVVVCKSANWADATPACTTSGGWEQGWIVFRDVNNNAAVGGAGEVIIERHQPLSTRYVLRGGAPVADYISFIPSGGAMQTTGAFQSGSVTLCRTGTTGFDKGKQVVISPAGRMRVCNTNPLSACPPSSLAENCQ